ncbi:MAG: sialidase family protein [Saprospiraceae bacterium]
MKKAIIKISFLLLVSLFISCKKSTSKMNYNLLVDTNHSGESNLHKSIDGIIYLSWIEYENDTTDILMISKLANNKWSTPKVVSKGSDWFTNWADFPSISTDTYGKTIFAHWLQKSSGETYDYNIKIAHSVDGGNTWSKPIIPHSDGVHAEHGFVSMVPTPNGTTLLTWLDGRNTKSKKNNSMTLRSAEIDKNGTLTNEVELDDRVCDCCKTGITYTDKGPIVVYRDRSMDEIRDIGIVNRVNNKWSVPRTLYNDNWKIVGCPVNGPAIDSKSNGVVVAWFTNANNKNKVFVSMSEDFGNTFFKPMKIDDGNPLGRVDVKMVSETEAIVLWMENDDDKSEIKIVKIDIDKKKFNSKRIAKNSSSRSSGFPVMVTNKDQLIIAWTNALDSLSKINTTVIEI